MCHQPKTECKRAWQGAFKRGMLSVIFDQADIILGNPLIKCSSANTQSRAEYFHVLVQSSPAALLKTRSFTRSCVKLPRSSVFTAALFHSNALHQGSLKHFHAAEQ